MAMRMQAYLNVGDELGALTELPAEVAQALANKGFPALKASRKLKTSFHETFLVEFGAALSEDVAPPAPPSRSLVESAGSVTGDLFQAKWAAISDQDERTLRVGPVTQGADLVDAMLASLHVHTMASGQVGEELKFFVYARDALGALYLAQAVISTASMETQLTVKTEGAGDASFFAGIVEEGLRACS